MMTKVILGMVITATLIIGTFSLGAAFALEQGDKITIKSQREQATCTTSLGNSCGTANLRSQFSLSVTDMSDTSFSGSLSGGIKVQWDESSGSTLEIKSFKAGKHGTPDWIFDTDPDGTYRLTISRTVADNNGETWDLSVIADNFVKKNNGQYVADIKTILANPAGVLFGNSGAKALVSIDGL